MVTIIQLELPLISSDQFPDVLDSVVAVFIGSNYFEHLEIARAHCAFALDPPGTLPKL